MSYLTTACRQHCSYVNVQTSGRVLVIERSVTVTCAWSVITCTNAPECRICVGRCGVEGSGGVHVQVLGHKASAGLTSASAGDLVRHETLPFVPYGLPSLPPPPSPLIRRYMRCPPWPPPPGMYVHMSVAAAGSLSLSLSLFLSLSVSVFVSVSVSARYPLLVEACRTPVPAAAYDPTVGDRAGSPSPTAAAARWHLADDLDTAEYGEGYPGMVRSIVIPMQESVTSQM